MFERAAHVPVAALLNALDSRVLNECACAFGGGTRIALELGEFRESNAIDFLTSDAAGFAALRILLKDGGCGALFSQSAQLSFPREPKIDQYDVRFPVLVSGASTRVEFIREARIALDPAVAVPWSRAPCLGISDCFAEKLLANSDRWPDDSVLSRDLIDLAALTTRFGPIPREAWQKAEGAYRSAARADLRKASSRFISAEAHRARCFDGLAISTELQPGILDPIGRWAEGRD